MIFIFIVFGLFVVVFACMFKDFKIFLPLLSFVVGVIFLFFYFIFLRGGRGYSPE